MKTIITFSFNEIHLKFKPNYVINQFNYKCCVFMECQ